MWFITLALKNVWRRKVRSLLTCVSIAVAACAVVSLLGTAEGYERSYGALYEARQVDLVVVRAGTTQRIASSLDEAIGEQIRGVPGVITVEPTLADLVNFEEAQLFAVYVLGLTIDGLHLQNPPLVGGRALTREDRRKAVVGALLARQLGKKVGDTVEIEGEPFEIVGVSQSDNQLQSTSIVVPIQELQELMGRTRQVTLFSVWTEEAADKVAAVQAICHQIEALRDGQGRSLRLAAQATQDHAKSLFELQLLKGFAWAASTIALVIGLMSMLNTMMMSITEQLREIATLRAVGWTKRRVMSMIVLESLVLSVAGCALGVLLAVPLLEVLSRYSVTSTVVVTRVTLDILSKAVALGMLAGTLGALYPGWMASRLLPSQALRYE